MANPEHLRLVLSNDWNDWRNRNPGVTPDLTGADLSGKDVSGRDLRRADLTRANLSGATLAGTDLTRATVTMARLDGISVCRELRTTSAVPILMVTARTDEADRVIGLEPETLITGHGEPISGADEIRRRLSQMRDATQYIRDRTFEIELLDTGGQAFAFTFG